MEKRRNLVAKEEEKERLGAVIREKALKRRSSELEDKDGASAAACSVSGPREKQPRTVVDPFEGDVALFAATLAQGDEARNKVESDRLGLDRERLEFEKEERLRDREERAQDREDRREEARSANDLDLQKFRIMMGVFAQHLGGNGDAGRAGSVREDENGVSQPSKERGSALSPTAFAPRKSSLGLRTLRSPLRALHWGWGQDRKDEFDADLIVCRLPPREELLK